MIDLTAHGSVLHRFARDLDAQSPQPLDGLLPDLCRVAPEDARAARVAWAMRIIDEYRSVTVFSDLLRLLSEIEAPFETLCAMQRLIGDELRHTKLCADVVHWLGGFRGIEIDLSELTLPPSDDPPESRALEIVVRELVVAETESIVALRAYRDATTDPAIHRALSILLTDEVRHAAAGRALADVLLRTIPKPRLAPFLDRMPSTIAEDTTFIRAEYTANALDTPGRGLGASLRPSDLPW